MLKIGKQMLIVFTIICCLCGSLSAQLTTKQQSIIPIAAYTAKGELQKLKPALKDGLDTGLTENEIKEVIVHLYGIANFYGSA